MNMVLIHPNLKKYDFIPLCDFQANFLEFLIDLFRENHLSVFRRTNKVVQKNRYIVLFVDIFAHLPILGKLKAAASCGELDPRD